MIPHHEDPEEHPEDYWENDDVPISWPWRLVGLGGMLLIGAAFWASFLA